MSFDNENLSTPPRQGVGLAALVLGVLGLALSFVPFLSEFVAIPCAVAAVIASYIGCDRVERGLATNRKDAVIGGLLGGLALMMTVFINLAVYSG
ncbi:hypothetical protein [Nocardia mangyaensis]|uniref:hypothetical protein n=1 Tax=Nocardia mangyaensis TaxID=2213200 RepID=UPI0026755120|nr:hypothetical protein [Nocardia mangyaensis]MDO3645836.1 hypothetical protein [Nocardia mangyaensis]